MGTCVCVCVSVCLCTSHHSSNHTGKARRW
uniref:Uncharacterized protein n=1 Tax=Anguilla anguilla TaxID=7936 RepID=A0A0E9QTC0_ANGAN